MRSTCVVKKQIESWGLGGWGTWKYSWSSLTPTHFSHNNTKSCNEKDIILSSTLELSTKTHRHVVHITVHIKTIRTTICTTICTMICILWCISMCISTFWWEMWICTTICTTICTMWCESWCGSWCKSNGYAPRYAPRNSYVLQISNLMFVCL